MKDIYTVAHTHWDFEWYFTRQEAGVQFAFHMDEVLSALEENRLDYYVLDGQMSILDDYLSVFPEKTALIKKYVIDGRLFVGPWFTQIDEMTTSGESIVRNLRLGIREAEGLGGAMRIGYLPDSFGQSQDMPKIYRGFGIQHAIFWRGVPTDANTRYFYWTSNDGSKVLTANIKNGYYAGVDMIENDNFETLVENISTQTESSVHLLPVGGDQRAVDFNLKDRISLANQETFEKAQFIESNYPEFFRALEKEKVKFPELSGEFIDPSDSKIHRGIYSSRYDLKKIYDQLERIMTYQVEPMSVLARFQRIEVKQGLINKIWKVIARGQAHDSAGGCNSDKTNQDIHMRGLHALQEAQSLMDYLLRKLSISIHENKNNELFIWNPLPFEITDTREFSVSTRAKNFELLNSEGQRVPFEILDQQVENAALLRRNSDDMEDDTYFVTTIACESSITSMGWISYKIVETTEAPEVLNKAKEIENEFYTISFQEGKFHLLSKVDQKRYQDFLKLEDGGDEGDTYDYSPAFDDWLINLDFSKIEQQIIEQGSFVSRIKVEGVWELPYDLQTRKDKKLDSQITYVLELKLSKGSNVIGIKLSINNRVLDHRLRLVINTNVKADHSFSDTPFGVIERPVEDLHLKDWKEIGYKEEPTSMRPMIHFANIHSESESWTFLTKGSKDFQIIGDDYKELAITIFRSVGYLGRPDMLRRPGDASGLQTKVVATPDSQLMGEIVFEGGIILGNQFNSQKVQMEHLLLTQSDLYYQTQSLNRFTTPIQYFPINRLMKKITDHSFVSVKNLSVVFSSLSGALDNDGIELRFYNSTDEQNLNPGSLSFADAAEVVLLDLEGRIICSVASQVNKLEMAPFGPGEIRTYGIFLNRKEEELV